MSLTLYAHPFSSYCWKVQIPLDADGTPYTYRNVDPSEPGAAEELRRHWPIGKFPVLLGEGKRILDGSQAPGALKLVDHFISDSGVIIASYEPAGDVPTGSFETKPPSQEELERRENWQDSQA